MNVLLINVPSRKGKGGFMLPLGLLYVGAIIERYGHKAKIVDLYLENHSAKNFDPSRLDDVIENFKPNIVGYGGIATSYGITKQLSLYMKERYPEIIQIAGGALASTFELLLTKAKVDVVFHGEAEVGLPIFLERLVKGESIRDIPGTSCLLNGQVTRNPPTKQIEDLDEIPFPAYHLVDVTQYLHPVQDWIDVYKLSLKEDPRFEDLLKNIRNKTHFIPIITSRGCTYRCLFCYRHVRGFRQHSVKYVIEHIKYLQKTYGVNGFQFSDELFNENPAWVMEFCDAIEQNNLDIFYIVGGARVDKVDEKMLCRLKETGCVEIDYGQESGSDIILREYRKGVTSQKNKEATTLTNQVGIFSPVQLVIGSPSETDETINETIQFLKDVNAHDFALNYLIPLPETPIWRYVTERKLITDVEKYLDNVAEYGGAGLLVNLTKESDQTVSKWAEKISYEMTKNYYETTNRLGLYFLYLWIGKARIYFGPFIPPSIKKKIGGFLKRFYIKI